MSAAQLIVFAWVLLVSWPIAVRSAGSSQGNASDPANGAQDKPPPLSTLEEALAALNKLSASQKQILKERKQREQELQERSLTEKKLEAERTKTLEQDQKILQDLRGQISRKLKAMSRPVASNAEGTSSNSIRMKDCADYYMNAEETSGVYRVWPHWDPEHKGFLVYCDMETDGGGWTVLRRWGMNRFPKSFYNKTWNEYKNGFGDINQDYWLGNEVIHLLTNQALYEMRFDIGTNSSNLSTTYNSFWTDSEGGQYVVHVGQMLNTSTAGDLFSKHADAPFSTSDRNNLKATSEPSTGRNGRQPPQQAPNCTTAWWFQRDCNINESLDTTSTEFRGAMKIRPNLFITMKDNS